MLVDVNMPRMDGFELTRRLRASHPRTLVALISAQHPEELRRAGGSDEHPVFPRRTCGPPGCGSSGSAPRRLTEAK